MVEAKQRIRRANRRHRDRPAAVAGPGGNVSGGLLTPLTEAEAGRIHEAACALLSEIGMADAPPFVVEMVKAAGGESLTSGRLRFPRTLVDRVVEEARRDVCLYGRGSAPALDLSGAHVHFGSGGAAVEIIDLDTGAYRPTTLRDLYDAARVVDACPQIDFFSRSMIARDVADPAALDLNTAYACLAGTFKHVSTSLSLGAHVAPVAELCAAFAEAPMTERPILSLNVNHVVPPMRFAPEACGVLREAARRGIPVHLNALGQAGASSPASLAGALAQSVAEALAGLILVWLVNPRCPAIFGPRPLITDLRTGAMSGGGGEQAIVMAAAAQMGRFYRLPNSCIAGATDSKLPDAQSGHEKALTVALAAHGGAHMVTQAAGMQASLSGVALESYVIDDDMIGATRQSLRGLDVTAEALDIATMADAILGEGHFLGAPDTYNRMKRDFLYPVVGDRGSIDDWDRAGRQDVRARAQTRVRSLLSEHFPETLSEAADAGLRARADILLPRHQMQRCE